MEQDGYQAALEHEVESRFAISNGFLGVRASLQEPTIACRPRTFITGLFDAPRSPLRDAARETRARKIPSPYQVLSYDPTTGYMAPVAWWPSVSDALRSRKASASIRMPKNSA
jgi:hypothetical protein